MSKSSTSHFFRVLLSPTLGCWPPAVRFVRVAAPCLVVSLIAPSAAGQSVPSAVETSRVAPRPPPINVDYLQFGAAVTGEFNINPGAICPKRAQAPCVLGSGGGVAARAGYRSRGPWYLGGAYEFDRVDTSSIMRLGVLQQLRAEARYYYNLGLRTEPYLSAGLGGAALGNEWSFEALGLSSHLGAGFEVQLTRTTVVGLGLAYRPILLFGWTDRAQQHRETGMAHFLGLDVVLEAREPLGSH